MYKTHFSHTPLLSPRKKNWLLAQENQLLFLALKTKCTSEYIHIVPAGTPILGMDLFNDLQLQIRDVLVTTETPSAVPVQYTAAVTENSGTRTVSGFVHKVMVKPEIQHVQQKVRRIASAPSAFQWMISQILAGLEGVQCSLDDIIVYADTPTLHEMRLKALLQ